MMYLKIRRCISTLSTEWTQMRRWQRAPGGNPLFCRSRIHENLMEFMQQVTDSGVCNLSICFV